MHVHPISSDTRLLQTSFHYCEHHSIRFVSLRGSDALEILGKEGLKFAIFAQIFFFSFVSNILVSEGKKGNG